MNMNQILNINDNTPFRVVGKQRTYKILNNTMYYLLDSIWMSVSAEIALEILLEKPENIIRPKHVAVSPVQLRMLKALYALGYNYLAKDSSNRVYAYPGKPRKTQRVWEGDYYHPVRQELPEAQLYSLVEWKDDEPLNIRIVLDEHDVLAIEEV